MNVSRQFLKDFAYLANYYGWTPADIDDVKADTRTNPDWSLTGRRWPTRTAPDMSRRGKTAISAFRRGASKTAWPIRSPAAEVPHERS